MLSRRSIVGEDNPVEPSGVAFRADYGLSEGGSYRRCPYGVLLLTACFQKVIAKRTRRGRVELSRLCCLRCAKRVWEWPAKGDCDRPRHEAPIYPFALRHDNTNRARFKNYPCLTQRYLGRRR